MDAATIQKVTKGVCIHPHPKVARGNLIFADTDECKEYGRGGTSRISRTARLDLSANIVLGPWVMLGHGCVLFTHSHKFTEGPDVVPRLIQQEQDLPGTVRLVPKVIGANVWIYYSAVILPGCNYIASDCIIGTGSVVTKPITEPGTVWAGSPARKIGDLWS